MLATSSRAALGRQMSTAPVKNTAQPLNKHYNGQGCVRGLPGPAHAHASHSPHRGRLVHPSAYLPLADEAFMAGFEARWGEHVDFGTSRSHKKKGKAKTAQPVEWTLDASGNPVEKTRDEAPPPKKQRPAKAAPPEDARGRPRERVKTQATNTVLTSKGRFAGTLAASLLGGASAGKT